MLLVITYYNQLIQVQSCTKQTYQICKPFFKFFFKNCITKSTSNNNHQNAKLLLILSHHESAIIFIFFFKNNFLT